MISTVVMFQAQRRETAFCANKLQYKTVLEKFLCPYPILRQTASWMSDYLVVKPSAIGQPTWPTQPSIPHGSVIE